jgi:hypothetical protein
MRSQVLAEWGANVKEAMLHAAFLLQFVSDFENVLLKRRFLSRGYAVLSRLRYYESPVSVREVNSFVI